MVLRAVGVRLALALAPLLLACVGRGTPIQAPTVVFVEGVSGEPAGAARADGGEHATTSSWRAKEEVEVEWRGSWWPAVIVDKRGGNRWLIHYERFGDEWDEIVGADRIRERRAELQLENGEESEDDADP